MASRSIRAVELWPSTGSLKDGQLMSQRHVLEGDRYRPAEEGAEERPETDHKNHRHFLAGEISSEPDESIRSAHGGIREV